jgi:hypothetical protein
MGGFCSDWPNLRLISIYFPTGIERKSRFDIGLKVLTPVLPRVAAVVSDSREAPILIIP